ncbi:PEP/pyruvate-binding domain-containing protein [Portibacter marinus]|uniref:PEP/pyruvate-binding domain-containing protein n=1 Tax=Portibacter marinus TaxID=2898660 RepID=UPI001F1D58E9|nr:PEP/pyruvate-binding domain-containing protein [Portibacter marinus]
MYIRLFFILLAVVISTPFFGQKVSNARISQLISEFKEDPRGPYKDIKWFCEDGTVREARDPCPDDMEGHQHARYKDIVVRLQNDNDLYFATILTGSEKSDFWAWEDNYDPLKQYMLNKYLEDVDNGWIKRQAQFYRGAIQSEDELEWAREFFQWVLSSDTRLKDNYLLIRQAAKMIPHQTETKTGSKVRVLSKVIADDYQRFMPLRTKIHNNPEPSDIASVKKFRDENKVPESQKQNVEDLIAEMEIMFRPVKTEDLVGFTSELPESDLKNSVQQFIYDFSEGDQSTRITRASELLWKIRREINTLRRGSDRLSALDISITLERMIQNDLQRKDIETIGDLTDYLCYLNMAIAGCGYIEAWEYEKSDAYSNPSGAAIYLSELDRLVDHHSKIAEWASNNMTVLFVETVKRYNEFEPLASSFTDDQIRSTLLLPYGQMLSELADQKNEYEKIKNGVFDISGQERIRGLNPGYARGVLEVVEEMEENMIIDKNKIYIFNHPPSDIGPVTGIMTVNEGNAVSHVQLLARNLGIPNAVISEDNLKALKKFDGEEIFYAVSLSGNVIMKKTSKMNDQEKGLFSSEERNINTITVDTDRIDLERDSVINMRNLSGKDSGISCGPKAANLAQLKRIFPNNVVEGIVIPFGVYKDHMDQEMDTRNMTYWEFINQIFKDKAYMLSQGVDEKEVECIVEGELGILRENIYNINLKEDFIRDFKREFTAAFDQPVGNVPVFLRSDTNMEDLKDFTGAGLNLTKFNILDPEAIYQGIREVWASPFTERSYKWRQSFLNNPENVYPSILVIPSVNVDYSGVIITKDIKKGGEDDMTIAFSRGVGGAVDGQRAETYIIKDNKYYEMLSPSRETKYRTIPPSGGSTIETSTFSDPILSYKNIEKLMDLVAEVKQEIPKQTEMKGPYDIELGFKDDKIWLFQIRPFVENKSANSSEYLQSISTTTDGKKVVQLSQPI